MEDRLIKVLPDGEMVSLWLYESTNQDGGANMSLKQREKVHSMEDEVIIAPADAANVVKALVEGASLLSSRGFYFAGFSDGQQELAGALKKRL
jgi:hypothetical protein